MNLIIMALNKTIRVVLMFFQVTRWYGRQGISGITTFIRTRKKSKCRHAKRCRI